MNTTPEDRRSPKVPPSGGMGRRGFPEVWAAVQLAVRNPQGRLRLGLGAGLIGVMVLVAYSPVLTGGLVIDDESLIGQDNPLVNGTFTPWTLWFQTDFTLTTFGWWLQRLVWGSDPAGYHAVSLVLQALSGVLLWRVLEWLRIPGAWLGAVLFVVHPVCVNSVARISELKNTLSLPFYLFSLLAYLHYESVALYPEGPPAIGDRTARRRASLWYVFSFVAYVLALLSKTTAAMLPVLVLCCAAWQSRAITRRDVLHTLPFFILALSFGWMSVWFQKHQALVHARLSLGDLGFLERLAGAGKAFWFYAGKALIPVKLSVVYQVGSVDTGSLTAYVPILLACAVFILCWRFRGTWGRPMLFGLCTYAVGLFPALGFFDAQFLTMGRVADHLQYHALISMMALVAAAVASIPNPRIFWCLAVASVLTLSVLTHQRAQVFSNQESLMRDTLAKNPTAWTSHNDLGVVLAKRQDYPGAIQEFQASLHNNPEYADARLNLGVALVLQGKPAEAESQFLAVLKVKPYEPEAHRQLAQILKARGKDREALYHLEVALDFADDRQARMTLASWLLSAGDSRQAAEQLRRVIKVEPDNPEALNNLAWILATSSDDTVRSGVEAIGLAEKACRLTAYKQAGLISTLAAAYAEAGRFPEAIKNAETAADLQMASGHPDLAAINHQLLNLYRNGQPYHTPSPPRSGH